MSQCWRFLRGAIHVAGNAAIALLLKMASVLQPTCLNKAIERAKAVGLAKETRLRTVTSGLRGWCSSGPSPNGACQPCRLRS